MKRMEWCRRHDILTGADWLLYLVACILRDPFEPTPYLFLWGPEAQPLTGHHISREDEPPFTMRIVCGYLAFPEQYANCQFADCLRLPCG